jgi:uncharacterized protein
MMVGRLGVLFLLLVAACGGPQVPATGNRATSHKKVTEPPRWKDPPVRVRAPSGTFEVEYPAFLERAPATADAWLVLTYKSAVTDVKLEFLRLCPLYDPGRDGLACAYPPCRLFLEGGQYLLVGGTCINAVDAIWWWPTTPTACVELTGQVENHVGGDPYGGDLVRNGELEKVSVRRVLDPSTVVATPSSSPAASAPVRPVWRRLKAERRHPRVGTVPRECEKGDYGACAHDARDLVWSYMPGDDLEAAVNLYQRACEGFRAEGCFGAGMLHLKGFGVPRDPTKAAKSFEEGCRNDHLASCAELGLLLLAGRGVSKDVDHARQLFVWSCVPKEASGCTGFGLMHERGEGAVRDPARAATFYRQACDAGHAAGCGRLGGMVERGMAGAADRRAAVELYTRACRHGDPFGCAALGRLHLTGGGVARDPEWARVLLLRGCLNGEAESCAVLANVYETDMGGPRDPANGAELRRTACTLGHGASCTPPPPRAEEWPLSRADIQLGMRGVQGSVARCFDRYQRPGLVEIAVTVQPSGKVLDASAVGPFTGTPTGACVAKAIRKARFKSFSGTAFTLKYPIVFKDHH